MPNSYDRHTVRHLRELVWDRGLVAKRWMLNYIRKKEAITLLVTYNSEAEVPVEYKELIKKRSADHRKKVYQSRKDRQAKFGAPLTRDERLKLIMNNAESLTFKDKVEHDDGFTSYLGSTRGKIAFVFNDANGVEYLFTKSEVQKLSALGLYVPRGVMNATKTTPTTAKTERRKRLKDLYNDGS